MREEQRDLLRQTNILCNLVFSFCKKKECTEGDSLARDLSGRLREMICVMEEHLKNSKD